MLRIYWPIKTVLCLLEKQTLQPITCLFLFPSWISKSATNLPLGQLLWPATNDGFQFLVWIELKVFDLNNTASSFIHVGRIAPLPCYPIHKEWWTTSFRDTSEGISLHKHNMIGCSQSFSPLWGSVGPAVGGLFPPCLTALFVLPGQTYSSGSQQPYSSGTVYL